MTPNGEINKNITQFVVEWQIRAECSVETTAYRGACSRSNQFDAYAKAECAVLSSGIYVFKLDIFMYVVQLLLQKCGQTLYDP